MKRSLFLKGFEVELFTGRKNGEHIGVALDVKKDLSEFVIEPDHRNLEYITEPKADYESLYKDILEPRIKLRNWLLSRNLTIIPCSTLSLGNSKVFERSDPNNQYHQLIEDLYGTNVVTTSIHINLGIEDYSLLFKALRLVRCEASLFLALSASSPFLDRQPTGMHSQRWKQFPLTPRSVPLFTDYEHYVSWVEDRLSSGEMNNERHLWTSVRPNGPKRPYNLNRLELRICDFISDPLVLVSLTLFLELRIRSLFQNPDKLDPLQASSLTLSDLAKLSDANDQAAASLSLDASLCRWQNGDKVSCREWIEELLSDIIPLSKDLSLDSQLLPLYSVIQNGNQSMQWLNEYSKGKSIEKIVQDSILDMQRQELGFFSNGDITK